MKAKAQDTGREEGAFCCEKAIKMRRRQALKEDL